MPSGSVSISVICENTIWSQSLVDTGGGYEKHVISLPAGLAGSSVHGATDSVITLATGHGLTTASVVSVAWTGGKRIGMTVSAYDGTSITVTNSTGVGDTYPSGTVDVIVCTATAVPDIGFDGDEAKFLLVMSDQRATLDFLDSGAASLLSKEIAIAGDAYYWSLASGVANPLTGNAVASAKAYNHSIAVTTITVCAVLST
jgi:hypothetical protein